MVAAVRSSVSQARKPTKWREPLSSDQRSACDAKLSTVLPEVPSWARRQPSSACAKPSGR